MAVVTYAIFKAAGFQYRAEPGDVLRLPTLDAEAGKTVTFDHVLFASSAGDIAVGRPTIKGAVVRAEVLRHGRGDKIIVFKFKRRKNYRRKTGHRQDFTEVKISEIDLGGGKAAAKSAEPKKESKAKRAPKAKAETKPKAEAKKTKAASKVPAAKAKKTKPASKAPAAKAKKAKSTKKKDS